MKRMILKRCTEKAAKGSKSASDIIDRLIANEKTLVLGRSDGWNEYDYKEEKVLRQSFTEENKGVTIGGIRYYAQDDPRYPQYRLNCEYAGSISSVKNYLKDGKHLVIESMAPGHNMIQNWLTMLRMMDLYY